MTIDILYILAAYLLGAIPFGLLFGRMAGIDVRQSGSGNIGATNVNRLLGKKLGIATLLCDIGKGFLPMYFVGLLSCAPNIILLSGAAAFLGHIYPIYLGFKGGKGVATALGVFLYLNPLAVLFAIILFVIVVYLSGYVSLGSLLGTGLMPVFIHLLHGETGQIILAGFVALLVWIKHRENIIRLVKHEEKSWKKTAGK
jgi:glycerol-3-phosphate acyltransferase PlsY